MPKIRRKSKANQVKPDPKRVAELEAECRNKDGTFKPGKTGRMLQRATKESHNAYIRRLTREWTEDCVQALGSIVVDERRNDSARVKAASILLDRAYGKATQVVETVKGDRALHEIPTEELVELLKKHSKPKELPAAKKRIAPPESKELPEPQILAADGFDATP